jgi:hypothetical protein
VVSGTNNSDLILTTTLKKTLTCHQLRDGKVHGFFGRATKINTTFEKNRWVPLTKLAKAQQYGVLSVLAVPCCSHIFIRNRKFFARFGLFWHYKIQVDFHRQQIADHIGNHSR